MEYPISQNIIAAAYLTGAAEALKKSLVIGHEDIEKNIEDLKPLRRIYLDKAETDGYKEPNNHIYSAKLNAYKLLKTTTQFPNPQPTLAQNLQVKEEPTPQSLDQTTPPSQTQYSMQQPQNSLSQSSLPQNSLSQSSLSQSSLSQPSVQPQSSLSQPSVQPQNSFQPLNSVQPLQETAQPQTTSTDQNSSLPKITTTELSPPVLSELPPTLEPDQPDKDKLPTVVQLGGAKKTRKRKIYRRKTAVKVNRK